MRVIHRHRGSLLCFICWIFGEPQTPLGLCKGVWG